MKKLGRTNKGVIIEMTPTEFSMLAGKAFSNIPEGTEISLKKVKAAINLRDKNMPKIKELVALASGLE